MDYTQLSPESKPVKGKKINFEWRIEEGKRGKKESKVLTTKGEERN